MTNVLYLAKMDETMAPNTKTLLELADKELQRLSRVAARSLKFYRQRTAPARSSLEELMSPCSSSTREKSIHATFN